MKKINLCKCGCSELAKYAYAPGHRPASIPCTRCGRVFAPLSTQGTMCSQCRRHVRNGQPESQITELVTSRKMQALSPDGRRWCSGCERYRLLRFFGTFREKGRVKHYSRCKPCHRAQSRASALQKKYNISLAQYDALKAQQGGKCAICQRATGATKNLSVDHDHACCHRLGSCGNCIRGLLCSTCNNMLGFARDDPKVFQRAIEYLASPPFRSTK